MAKRPPSRSPYTSLPVNTYAGWDNLGDVHSALRQLEQGSFRTAAIMYDQMFRDDRFRAVMDKRLDALDCVPLDLRPADDSDQARKIAEELGGTEDAPGEWDRIFVPSTIRKLQKYGLGLGVGIAEKIYDATELGSWRPRLKPWHPQFLRWDMTRARYMLMTANAGEIELPDITTNPHGDDQWFLWFPYGYEEAWLEGLVHSLPVTVMERTWCKRDHARYNEKNGAVIDKAIMPPGALNTDAGKKFWQSVQDRHGESAVACEQGGGENGQEKFDLQLLETASGRGWETFTAARKEHNDDLAITVLGQNLTTSVVDGKGSLGVKGHENVELNKLRKDAGITVPMRDQVLVPYCEHNFRKGDLAPRPIYMIDPPDDQQGKATAMSTTIQGLATAKLAELPVDERKAMEEAGIPLISEEEQAARAAVAAEERAQMAEQMAGGGGPDKPDGGGGGGVDDEGADGDDDEEKAKKPGKETLSAARRPPKVVNRYQFAGLPIAVENPKGTTRDWPGGSTRMQFDYGFIEGHYGWDDDEVDVYVGPDPKAGWVHVVHQLESNTYDKYDEDKVFLGFESQEAVRRAYAAHRNDGERAIKSISSMPLDAFHRTLRRRKGAGPIRAGALVDTTNAIMRLVSRSQQAAKGQPLAVLRAGQPARKPYAENVTEHAVRLAARALAVDLAAVKDEIRHAADFADLEKRLAVRFAKMDPARLAAVIKKARLMAHLGGQLSAVKETPSVRVARRK